MIVEFIFLFSPYLGAVFFSSALQGGGDIFLKERPFQFKLKTGDSEIHH